VVQLEIDQARVPTKTQSVNRALPTKDERLLPAVRWATHRLWQEAHWSAVAYQFDQATDSPPVMALIFDDPNKGCELFKIWTQANGNCDELEEIRVGGSQVSKSADVL
jgi:hypothetical protein